MGLLQEALLSIKNSSTNFNDWSKFYGFENVAILESKFSEYHISHAVGIDVDTIFASVSSCDFWVGTLKKSSEWFCAEFGTKEALPFYQILSSKFKDKAKYIYFLRLKEEDFSPILMVLSFEKQIKLPSPTLVFIEKLLAATKNSKASKIFEIKENKLFNIAYLFSISLKHIMQTLKEKNNLINSDLCTSLCNTCYEDIFFLLKNTFAKRHYVYAADNFEIKLALYLKKSIDTKLFQSYIEKTILSILDNKLSSKIEVLSLGTAINDNLTKNFLLNN